MNIFRKKNSSLKGKKVGKFLLYKKQWEMKCEIKNYFDNFFNYKKQK